MGKRTRESTRNPLVVAGGASSALMVLITAALVLGPDDSPTPTATTAASQSTVTSAARSTITIPITVPGLPANDGTVIDPYAVKDGVTAAPESPATKPRVVAPAPAPSVALRATTAPATAPPRAMSATRSATPATTSTPVPVTPATSPPLTSSSAPTSRPASSAPLASSSAPTTSASRAASSIAVSAAPDLNCVDFQFQEDAQILLDQDPTDTNGLDTNWNKIACETLPHRPPPSFPPVDIEAPAVAEAKPETLPQTPGAECVPPTGNYNGVRPHVAVIGAHIQQKFNVTTVGGKSGRSRVSDHPLGLALDFMTNTGNVDGDAIAEYLYQHASDFGVRYIIWKQRIRYPGKDWVKMEDRGSITENHFDHLHTSFFDSPGPVTPTC